MGSTILLADGSVASQNSGKKILTDAGYQVVTVSNGLAARNKISELHPGIALLDVYMPGYSGLEICEKTKAAPDTTDIFVLLTVGKMEAFRAEDGLKAGADGVITKPFEAKDLIASVGKFLPRAYSPEPATSVARVGPKVEHAICSPSENTPAPPPARSELAELMQTAVNEMAPATPVAKPRGHDPVPCAVRPAADAAASHTSPPRSKSSEQGGEVCDVCGHVNAENAVVCLQCDVPLPSSVLPLRTTAPHRL